MTDTTITSVPVSFDDAGSGEPALVYLNGWCSDRTTFTPMLERTSRYRRSIAVDWRGHGTSPLPDGDFGWAQMADDVLAVLDACGVERFVPVANAHAGWVARDLARRAPERVAGVVLIGWMVLGAPPEFAEGLAVMADPATTRAAVDGLTASWLTGHEDLPGLPEQIAAMRRTGDDMWARAGREILTAFTADPSPLHVIAGLPATPPVRHLYAEPKDGAFLAAQEDFAATHPWFSVRRLDDAHTHFPMLEQPGELADDVLRFVESCSSGS